MDKLINFIGIFVIVFLYYYLFIVLKSKKKKQRIVPVELKLLLQIAKIKINDDSYHKLIVIASIVCSLDMAIVVTIVYSFVENVYLIILLSIALLIPIVFISFKIVGFCINKKK